MLGAPCRRIQARGSGVGEVFAGRYRRVKELGRGGIGIAHLCLDEKTGEDVVAAASRASEDQDGSRRFVVVKHAWGYLGPIDRADKMMRAENEALKARIEALEKASKPKTVKAAKPGAKP